MLDTLLREKKRKVKEEETVNINQLILEGIIVAVRTYFHMLWGKVTLLEECLSCDEMDDLEEFTVSTVEEKEEEEIGNNEDSKKVKNE